MELKKSFVSTMNKFRYKYDMHSLFSDFVKASAIAIHNSSPMFSEQKEKQYMDIVAKYGTEVMNQFSYLLSLVVISLEHEPKDFLGEVYMELGLGDQHQGQFFTPMHVSELMAELTFSDLFNKLNDGQVVTVNEPAVGGGSTIIGLIRSLNKRNIPYSQNLHVTCNDISEVAVHMCYVQLSLLGVNARVLLGDTITQKFRDDWYTPLAVISQFKQEVGYYEKDVV